MKHSIAIVISLLFSFSAYCQIFSVDGIHYQVLPNQKDVAVICPQDSTCYSGKIAIPSSVSENDRSYKVTHIYNYAFYGSDISSITLPEGLLEIGYEAFRQCYSLKSVVIPSTVLNIAANAFLFCFDLASLSFKSSNRPIIGSNAFGRTKVNVAGVSTDIPGNMAVPTQDGNRFSVDAKKGIVVY